MVGRSRARRGRSRSHSDERFEPGRRRPTATSISQTGRPSRSKVRSERFDDGGSITLLDDPQYCFGLGHLAIEPSHVDELPPASPLHQSSSAGP